MCVCLSVYLWCNASSAQFFFSYALLGFHNSRHLVLTPALYCMWNSTLPNKTKICPSPEKKMLCCDFSEKMMSSNKGFESKYPSHSSAQRFNRITLMFYLTGCFDKYVVVGGDDLLYLLEKTVVFRCTSGESQWKQLLCLSLILTSFFTLSDSFYATSKPFSITTCPTN